MDPTLQELARERRATLSTLSDEAIMSLPPMLSETISAQQNVQVTQYHDVLAAGEHLVVVQASRERWFGLFTSIAVDGFALVPDGSRRELTEQEKWT